MKTKDNPNVGIVGYGVVGKHLARLFGANRVYDRFKGCNRKSDMAMVNAAQFTFVCVPTPAYGPKGSVDTSAVVEAVHWIESPIIIIRSTVPPGTTDHLREVTDKRIVFQPEYIGETSGHPITAMNDPGFSVLGGYFNDTARVADLYATVYAADHHYHFTAALTAELAKYMENTFYAAKVTFCNEWADIATAFGVEYNTLREAWLMDWRINRDHTSVYPHDRGWGGKCLPKDLAGIIAAVKSKGLTPSLMQAVEAVNVWQRSDRERRDYQRGPITLPVEAFQPYASADFSKIIDVQPEDQCKVDE